MNSEKREYQRRQRARYAAEGRCGCSRPLDRPDRRDCSVCRADKKKRYKSKKTLRKCVSCGSLSVSGKKVLCPACEDRRGSVLQFMKDQIREWYGAKCACPSCCTSEPSFLQIDHVHNDGAEQRRSGLRGANFTRYLYKLGGPDPRYQLLCANCNTSKAILGRCAHFCTG